MIMNILDPQCTSCAGLEVMVGCAPGEQQNALVDLLLDIDCKVYPAKSAEDACGKLQFHAFHIVIVDESYSVDIFRMMAAMPMAIRRNMYFVIIGNSLETGNMLQSYILSANLVVNYQDLPNFVNILQGYFLDNNRFYRTYYYASQINQRAQNI